MPKEKIQARKIRTRLLLAPPDLDYVEQFQLLSAVHLEMRREGATSARLVRRALLESHVGNYAASLQSALEAANEDPESPEAHFQAARSYILLALAKAEAIPKGPVDAVPTDARLEELLRLAMEEAQTVIRLNLRDEEALETYLLLESILDGNRSEKALANALKAHVT